MWESNSPRNSKFRLNSASHVHNVASSSPMVTRQRTELKSALHTDRNEKHCISNQNVLTGAGPLLSTPFMPQIKRALGLEPKIQAKYGDRRRHSFGIGITPASPTVPAGSLPHVRLTKTRRLSLSERNSSMLNKSSTVKIAPPVIGKVASPSLYHMRCNTSIQEDRSTPDTYAVISALKERRKRSINTFEDHPEPSMQQAKRRRQESQHSNASTSSMPSMPENFPDLTNADFRMRLDTPGLKRPSRPSQEDIEEWDNENSTKRHRQDARNNSILSSLSSSQRFIENQISKRKAESSFNEKENSIYVSKSQRKEPPKLTHLDIPYSAGNDTNRTPSVPVKEKMPHMSNGHTPSTPQMNNGHSIPTTQTEVNAEKFQTAKKSEASGTPVLRKMPTMKKTASIYSGLGSPASFKKAQYANVVATLDDYDADKEAEKQRVKQMLKDLDDSFTKKEAKPEVLVTSTSTLPMSTASVSTVTASAAVTTTVRSIKLDTSKTLSALEKLSKSPVQETAGQTSAATTQPSVSFKPLFGTPSSTQSLGSTAPAGLQTSVNLTGSSATAGNFSLSTSQPAVSTGTQSSSASTPTGFAFTLQKTTPSTGGLATSTAVIATTSAKESSQAQPSAAGGFSFGIPALGTAASTGPGGLGFSGSSSTAAKTSASTVTTTTPAAGFAFGSVAASTAAAPAPAAGGFSFGTATAPSLTTSTAPAPLSLGSQPAAPSAAKGFSFGGLGSTGASTAGFSFGGQASTAVTTVAGSQFGTVTTASNPTFNFGATASTAASGLTASSGATSAPAAGFAFGANPATTSVSTLFGTPAATIIQTPFASTAPSFNFGGAVKTTASASPFAFNTGTATASTGSTPFQTGQSTGTTPAATGLFAFGGTSTTSAPAFGAPSTQAAGVFGTTTQTPAFGGTNQPPAYPGFGTNPAPTFGSTNQTPAFGSAVSQTPAFGTANQTSAFGSSNQTAAFGVANQTPAFGSANQPPAFGAQNQTQAPAFGAKNQTAFGAGNQAPGFGSATPAFGVAANQQTSTPVFGATATSTSGSVFGNTGNTVTGFAKSHSTPAFSTSQDSAANTGTLNFGGTAPNVNPFGQTTPAKQTGAAFGQVGLDTTPKSQTGAMFQFGQANNNSAANGFDFSASAAPTGGSGTGGFNFMVAASSMPVFNFGATGTTPTATSNFGAPGSTPGAFAVGAGTAPRQPRVMARARSRRQQRK